MSSYLTLVTAPSVKPVAQATVKAHLRVDASDEDTLIDIYTDVATDVAEKRTGRTLITQTWGESFQRPSKKMPLSKGPAQSIVSVKFFDIDNVEQTATLSDFMLIKGNDCQWVESSNWPATYDREDAITVQYITGYGDGPADIPPSYTAIILLLVGLYHEMRMDASDIKANPIPHGVDSLINLEQVGWYG